MCESMINVWWAQDEGVMSLGSMYKPRIKMYAQDDGVMSSGSRWSVYSTLLTWYLQHMQLTTTYKTQTNIKQKHVQFSNAISTLVINN